MTPKFHRAYKPYKPYKPYKSYKSYKNQKWRPGDFAVFGAPVVWRGRGLSDADFCHAVGHDNDVCSGLTVCC